MSSDNIQGLETLEAWKKAKSFALAVYKDALPCLPPTEKWGLEQQIRRSAQSIPANIAEGHGRFHYQENIQFLRQARGSLEELLDDINICIDENYGEVIMLDALKQEGWELLKKLNGYIKYLRKCKAEDAGEKQFNNLPITI